MNDDNRAGDGIVNVLSKHSAGDALGGGLAAGKVDFVREQIGERISGSLDDLNSLREAENQILSLIAIPR